MTETLLIFLLFAIFAGQLPPDVNESHYLTKAKHGWDTNWCPDDLFLSSSFSHWWFYALFGWLNALFPLSGVAWVGRVITWLALALAWQRLSWNLLPNRWLAVVTASAFLLLNDQFHLAGEWVIGGFEAKGLAYAFVLLALSDLVHRSGPSPRVWIWLGVATSFHVLVGGWSWIAMLVAVVLGSLGRKPVEQRSNPSNASLSWGIPLWNYLAVSVGIAISLIGVLPPLLADSGATWEQVTLASTIYVQQRIAHHLSFGAFPVLHVARFVAMILCLIALARWLSGRGGCSLARWRMVYLFTLGSLAISFGGLLLCGISEQNGAFADWSNRWLRFYWFRLSDFAVPMALATGIGLILDIGLRVSTAMRTQALSVGTIVLLLSALGLVIFQRHQDPRPRADRKSLPTYPESDDRTVATYRNWKRVCQWIQENTPTDARFITPAEQQTFKWYAHRTEVVSWKDVPQDAASMIQWRERLATLHEPQKRYPAGIMSYSDLQLADLANRYDADYLVVPQWQVEALDSPTGLKQVYPADSTTKSTFVVFEF